MKQSNTRIVTCLNKQGDEIDKPKGQSDQFVNFLDEVAQSGFDWQTKTKIDRMWNQNRHIDS